MTHRTIPRRFLLAAAALVVSLVHARADEALPARVTFPSMDGRITLVGYVFMPENAGRAQVPAVVMMHGRAGAYSSLAHGRYDASTLSQRHRMWGRLWAAKGYLAILVDGFGPRGYPQGFPRFSYQSRPAALDEVGVRPFDAYAALRYLRTRSDVVGDRIGLQGWSNGASATLAAMADDTAATAARTPAAGFRAALVFYAGCGLHERYADGLKPYAAVRLFHGTGDEEVSSKRCATLVRRSQERGGDIAITLYPDATHDFDDPGRRRQANPANVAAKAAATEAAVRLFAEQLAPQR